MPESDPDGTLVSVVIPAFNAEAFVIDALESVRKQTHRPIEIVVVNDGSTDKTLDIVKNYAMKDTDKSLAIRLIDVGANKGVANALFVGVSQATGDYICWLSADDVYVDPSKTQRQLAAMKAHRGMWSYYRDTISGPRVSQAKRVRPVFPFVFGYFRRKFERDPTARLMMQFLRNPINGSSTMISRECVENFGQFDPSRRNMDSDGDLWMRYTVLGAKLVVLDGAPVFYREHGTQGSKRTEAMLFDTELTQMRVFRVLEDARRLAKPLNHTFWTLVFMLRPDVYRYRPMSVGSLFGYVINHPDEFSWAKRWYASRVLRKLAGMKSHVPLDKKNLAAVLEEYSKSSVIRDFEKRLREA